MVFNCNQMRGKNIYLLLFCLLLSIDILAQEITVVVEAESFDDPGGWVVDQQSIDLIGSSYLLAHGLGIPCEDATTRINFKNGGDYHVWVRTRNWAPAPVKDESPGQFQLFVNDIAVDTIFGKGKYFWNWHYGGKIKIENGKNEIRLHDLTGFEGRCDAIVFSLNEDLIASYEKDELISLRKEILGFPKTPVMAGTFDLIVVGGGVAGMSASLSAARLGLNVALIQNRPVLGGNNSSEIRVHQSSDINIEPFPEIGDITKEIDSKNPEWGSGVRHYGAKTDLGKLELIMKEPNISLFLEMHVYDAIVQNGQIQKIYAKDILTGEEFAFKGKLFSDCTGDGNLGYLAGADYRYGREPKALTNEELAPEYPDSLVLGGTLHWYTKETEKNDFPQCPWAHQFTLENYQNALQGAWNWETGFQYHMIHDVEWIRDNMFKAIYGNWAFQKNHPKLKEKFANYQLEWMAYILGKRESRRLMGDVIFDQHDIDTGTEYPDACVSSRWGIDIHYPDPENSKYFPGKEFRSIAYHPLKDKHPIRSLPYRCFYSRNINNLFMAGRCVSLTHIAHAMFRNQHTTGMMGEVVGTASSLCVERNCSPRELYKNHLNELLSALQEGIPSDN